jgi:DNA-binding NarL/FixJ family response regulator
MRDPLAVFVYARDPLCHAGVLAMLRDCPGVLVVEANDIDRAKVAVVVADVLTVKVARVIRAVQRGGVPRVLALISRVDEDGVVQAVTAGASAVLKWTNADPRRLAAAIAQVAGADALEPRQLVARLMAAARAGESSGSCGGSGGGGGGGSGSGGGAGGAGVALGAAGAGGAGGAAGAGGGGSAGGSGGSVGGRPGLSERDLSVLRLVAQGYDTAEVAEQLAYSESTIKGVLHGVMSRLDARNRSHAVAVALRGGLI